MSHAPVALLAGATGAVGSRLLARLLERPGLAQVVVVARSPAPLRHARLRWVHAELDNQAQALAGLQADAAFCCLGTTMRQAGSRAAFRAVDLHGVAAFAAAAHAAGASFFGLVSAAGADPRARNFYLRTKGEAEARVAALAFPSLAIMQPGLLRGARREFRLGERVGQVVAPLADRILLGPLARYRSVPVEIVARALDAAGQDPAPGTRRFDAAAMETLAHER
ncbi:NAD(P)H-binding protein [Thioalkalivibrio sp. XN279]|uniref:NAD(P)H-binding protein n=1 Tax=Thioalkalivibrio sp. XN279 TaxID=2714953 RepID=UPI00140DBDF5|nr:NAD(P)H-binding protein [Thioalkalivibrio sp. XN279]NHA14790.1 NAD(P)H-binding protein [Thioalkalivibrio sp. XN279]